MSDERTAEPSTLATNLPAAKPMPDTIGAIALSDQAPYIVPATLAEAYEYARLAVVLAPDSYDSDIRKVTIGVLAAMEAGLPPMYGLRNIAIINGRPTIWGDAAMALVQSKNLIENQTVREIGTSFDKALPREQWPDDFGFCVSIWRRGQDDPYIGTFTIADAKRAGLWSNLKKKPWQEHPLRMLQIRARAFPLRDGFADALAGLAIREEAEDHAIPEEKIADTAFLDDDDTPEVTAEPDPG